MKSRASNRFMREVGAPRGARSARALVATLAAAASAVACSTTMAPSPSVEASPAYRVSAPDSLTINILPEPAIVTTATVRPDGKITVPLIGELPVSGRTIPEITSEIETRIARYKRDPHVTVSLVGASSTDIVILGEVARQASFPLVKETRAVEAIGLVGGTTAYGWDSRIRVIRESNGEIQRLRVNLSAIRKGDLSSNLMLQPGDFIYVPPTPWASFGYALNTLLFPFQPLLGVGRAIGGNLLTP